MGRTRGRRKKEREIEKGSPYDLDNGKHQEYASIRDLSPGMIWRMIATSRYVQILLLLVIAGFFLRFYQLGFNSIWLDEGSTLSFARHSYIEIWDITAVGGENNPPLFHWMEHFMLMFGESEFVLRFLPALLGGLTIPVVYLIGKEMVDRNVGILSAALLTFSQFQIYYSQDARAYTTMLFFTALAVLFYSKAMKSKSYNDWLLFGACSSLAFYAHFYAFLPAFVCILHAVIIRFGEIKAQIASARDIAVGLASFIVISLPLILVTVGLFFKTTGVGATFGYRGLDLVVQTFSEISYFDIFASGFGVFVALLFFALFLIGCAVFYREDRSGFLFIILYIGIPIVASLILAPLMPMVPRYMIYLLPIYFVGMSMAFKPLCDIAKTKSVIYILLAAIVVISAPFLATYYTNFSKNDWRGFAGSISDQTAEGDFVVLVPNYIKQPFNYYYDNASDGTFEFGTNTAAGLQEISGQGTGNRIYYILTGDILSANPEGDAIAWLDQNTQFAGQYSGIYLFQSG